MEEKIIQYINQDLYTEVKAKEFEEFMYNGEADSSLNDIKDVYAKLEDLKSSHEKINSAIENICNGVYVNKPEVCSELRNFGSLVYVHLGEIETTLNDMTEALKKVLEEQVASDEALLDDLAGISEILGEEFDATNYKTSGGESAISGSATPQPSEPVPETTTTEVMPDGTVATTKTVEAPTAMATPEPQQVKTISQDAQPAPAVATGNASSNAETAASLGISEAQLETVKAVIRHEAGENPQEMINVASCLKNRMNAGNWGGSDPYSVVTAKGQFASYYNGYYKQYENGNYYSGGDSASIDQQINAILLGQQAPTHNYQSFRASSSPNGVQLSEGGNKYR